MLRTTVYVRSTSTLMKHCEVADGASDILCRVLGPHGVHTRTSVGLFHLPEGAAVELDLVATITDAPT